MGVFYSRGVGRTEECFQPQVCLCGGADTSQELSTEMDCDVLPWIQGDLYAHRCQGRTIGTKKVAEPEDVVRPGVDGISWIWREAKFCGNGRKKTMRIVKAAMNSIGLKEGLTETRMEIQDLIEDHTLHTKCLGQWFDQRTMRID